MNEIHEEEEMIPREAVFSNPQFMDIDADELYRIKCNFRDLYLESTEETKQCLDALNTIDGIQLDSVGKTRFLNTCLALCEKFNNISVRNDSRYYSMDPYVWQDEYLPTERMYKQNLLLLFSTARYPEKVDLALSATEKLNSSVHDIFIGPDKNARPDNIADFCEESGVYDIFPIDDDAALSVSNGCIRAYQGTITHDAEGLDISCRDTDLLNDIGFEILGTSELERCIDEINLTEEEQTRAVLRAMYKSLPVQAAANITFAYQQNTDNHLNDILPPTGMVSLIVDMGDYMRNVQIINDDIKPNNINFSSDALNIKILLPYQQFDKSTMASYSILCETFPRKPLAFETSNENIWMNVLFGSRHNDLRISDDKYLNDYQIIRENGMGTEKDNYIEGYCTNSFLGEHVVTIEQLAYEGKTFGTFDEMHEEIDKREMMQSRTRKIDLDEIRRAPDTIESLDDVIQNAAEKAEQDIRTDTELIQDNDAIAI